MNRIIYKTDEGGAAVIIPTDNATSAEELKTLLPDPNAWLIKSIKRNAKK